MTPSAAAAAVFVASNYFNDKNASGACTIKLSTVVIYGFLQKARVFVSGLTFQPSLMFAGEAGAYPRVEPLLTNTLAFYENL